MTDNPTPDLDPIVGIDIIDDIVGVIVVIIGIDDQLVVVLLYYYCGQYYCIVVNWQYCIGKPLTFITQLLAIIIDIVIWY